MTGRNTLGNNRAFCVFPEMDHLGSGIGLLIIIGDCHGIKFPDRMITHQDNTRILPGDGRAGFNLCPGDFRIVPFADATFGHEIVNSTFTLFVTGIPVLNR